MESLLLGIQAFAIEKVVSYFPPVFDVRWKGNNICPHCGGSELRTKDTFVRIISTIPIHEQPSPFQVKCISTDVYSAEDILIRASQG